MSLESRTLKIGRLSFAWSRPLPHLSLRLYEIQLTASLLKWILELATGTSLYRGSVLQLTIWHIHWRQDSGSAPKLGLRPHTYQMLALLTAARVSAGILWVHLYNQLQRWGKCISLMLWWDIGFWNFLKSGWASNSIIPLHSVHFPQHLENGGFAYKCIVCIWGSSHFI